VAGNYENRIGLIQSDQSFNSRKNSPKVVQRQEG
jgi:hypothetical protein